MEYKMIFSASIYRPFALMAAVSVFGCSKPSAHVGEEIAQAQISSGTATVAKSRYLQANGKIAGEDTALIEKRATVTAIDRVGRAITVRTNAGLKHQI
jgi:hypothetical protein